MSFTIKGKCSTFGGPLDLGVSKSEDLALYERKDLPQAPPGLFMDRQPEGTTGTARRLNSQAFYVAMRWAYTPEVAGKIVEFGERLPVVTSIRWLRSHQVTVAANGKSFKAWPCDFGPNGRTERIVDMSPGLATALGVKTDDWVAVTIEV